MRFSRRVSFGFVALAATLAAPEAAILRCAAADSRSAYQDYYASDDSDEQVPLSDEDSGTRAQTIAYPRFRAPCECCNPYLDGGAAGRSMPGQAPGDSGQPQLSEMAGQEQYAGLGGDSFTINSAPGGYIDNPVVGNWFRARYDVAINNPFPDVAEYFAAKPGNLGGPGASSPTGVTLRSGNWQIGSFYGEYMLAPRLSVFALLQIQRTDLFFPDNLVSGTTVIKNGGLGDTLAGLKYRLFADDCQYLTFQLKTYAPSGDASRGIGTGHVSLEPGFLYLRRLSDRLYFQGQFLDWIPVGGTDYAGNVLNYGVGFGYDILRNYEGPSPLNPSVAPGLRVTAVAEVVGWTVLNGKKTAGSVLLTDPNITESAAGYTVVNVKPGFRITEGLDSIYVGSGISVTGDRLYSDIFRVEYRRMF